MGKEEKFRKKNPMGKFSTTEKKEGIGKSKKNSRGGEKSTKGRLNLRGGDVCYEAEKGVPWSYDKGSSDIDTA